MDCWDAMGWKTTIMKMILGLTSITVGEVDVFGHNIKVMRKAFIRVSGQLLKLQVLSESYRHRKP